MPNDARPVSGWLFSRGPNHGLNRQSEHLGIGGKGAHSGRLIFLRGDDPADIVSGKTEISRWQWHHVVMVRADQIVRVYLDGKLEREATSQPIDFDTCFFGGRCDNDSNWEGRLDEIAVFDRALSAAEVRSLSTQEAN